MARNRTRRRTKKNVKIKGGAAFENGLVGPNEFDDGEEHSKRKRGGVANQVRKTVHHFAEVVKDVVGLKIGSVNKLEGVSILSKCSIFLKVTTSQN